jgi:alpha-beta hydrolase superfamily lysophospholipase
VERLVIRREEDRFRAADGTSLFWRRWLPRKARRVLLVVHGLAEHSGRYDAVGAWFAARDTAVHAFDLRGHGRSAGTLDRRDAIAVLGDDLIGVVERLRKDCGDGPIVLLGHELGGLLVLRNLASRALAADAAVTSGAALEGGIRLLPAHRWVAWLARLAPRLRVVTEIDPTLLSRDPGVARDYREDPLVQERLPVALAASLSAAVDEGDAFAASIRAPVLLLHGEDDAVCPPAGSRHCHALLRGGGHALRVYPRLRHEILNEPERDDILCDALRWIEERGL